MKLFADRKRKHQVLVVATVIGALLLSLAQALSTYQSSQVANYNRGVDMYKDGDVDGALKAFNQSLNAFGQAQNPGWFQRTFLPAPSVEDAALAYAHAGVLLLVQKKPELAVAAFKHSLILNPGDSSLGVLTSETDRYDAQALVVKYNLELLFKKNPSLAQQEGKGQGQGQGKPGDNPAPGNDPGRMPGKGNRDDI